MQSKHLEAEGIHGQIHIVMNWEHFIHLSFIEVGEIEHGRDKGQHLQCSNYIYKVLKYCLDYARST